MGYAQARFKKIRLKERLHTCVDPKYSDEVDGMPDDWFHGWLEEGTVLTVGERLDYTSACRVLVADGRVATLDRATCFKSENFEVVDDG